MFTDEFLDGLPNDPDEAAAMLCGEFKSRNSQIQQNKKDMYYEKYLEAYAVLQPFAETLGIDIDTLHPGKNHLEDISKVIATFVEVNAHIQQGRLAETFAAMQRKYQSRFGSGFMYEFTEGDLKRIQELINGLRDEITASDIFEPKHKQRILKRLEKLQAELHKKMSSLDGFWGLFGVAGEALGKFAENAKPFTDVIKEILQIVWSTQARAAELPSAAPFPLLTDGNEKKKDE